MAGINLVRLMRRARANKRVFALGNGESRKNLDLNARSIEYATLGQNYGQVTKVLGNGRFIVKYYYLSNVDNLSEFIDYTPIQDHINEFEGVTFMTALDLAKLHLEIDHSSTIE